MNVCTIEEMRRCDRRAAEEYGLSDQILMENAGGAVYDVVTRRYGIEGRHFVVLCGGGNNGGDGFVVARRLNSSGAEVRVFLLADEHSLKGAAAGNLKAAVLAGIPVQRLTSDEELYLGRSCDVVIDAMLGTGLTRRPEGLYAEVIDRVNASNLPVVSVDIPSGVNGDTGSCPGVAVSAEATVTFGLPKTGNLLPPGRDMCGSLYVSHISFPPTLYSNTGSVEVGRPLPLPARKLETHKGDYGDVLFVAGARTYLGAPVFAAMSFLKAGGGYARLAVPASVASLMGIRAPEAVIVPLEEATGGCSSSSNADALVAIAEKVDVCVLGPGVSLDDEAQILVRTLIGRLGTPVLVDGDGLTAISGMDQLVAGRTEETILTPHTAEMARLLGCDVSDVANDRVGAVRAAAGRYRATVVLKGSTTLVCGPDGHVTMNLSGNPGMATAGCGDVLAGTIPALMCVGMRTEEAAATGVFLHGLAGDMAAEAKGEDGITATDVMDHLTLAFRHYRTAFESIRRNYYGRISVI